MSKVEKPEIAVRENAFLRAANLPRLTDSDGSELECRPVMALCRCGQSSNKPFCDGSHKKQGFDGSGADNSARDSFKSYQGDGIAVHYNRLLCSHAAECGNRLTSVFDMNQRPWIQPMKGSAEEIMDVVRTCPSGALRYSLDDQVPQHIAPESAGVTVEKNGPYRVAGISLVGVEASPNGTPEKYVLCRCGLSKNKPFCDGTHKDEGWSDEG